MITLRKSVERGYADHGWLKSFHSFSFADYHDPAHMGVGNLRVINEDRIAPGTGFGTHGHRDMEIVSYVLDGALAHRDSMGNGAAGGVNGGHSGVILPGDVQRMSAGTGVMHSEFNHAKDGATHFLQIWIMPSRRGIAPGYEQKRFDEAAKRGRLALVAAPDGAEGAVTIHADASLRAGLFDGGESAELALAPQRLAYVFVARGSVQLNGKLLAAGDAATLAGEEHLQLAGGKDAEVLVFDLAA
ncbi:Quercetin 2,3-dioxygenase [Rubrivivax sp. A210]|uniref:pirin family protein n=1 Tax=Rubrivivax sp. A210 TaxID=2772301 RepID=UPI001917B34A|nr:pirin family protein [Rubrivivax sp. A210]CAD5374867.1 Quercetin 2,3-dioxygenase [Rubrivivax sp. A210]